MITIEALHRKFLECSGVCTDTRAVRAGSMFFALKGPNYNANTFAQEALSKGSRYAVVDDPDVAIDDRYLFVPDAMRALQELARHHRRTFDIPIIGITGTNGKTTTKELLYAVLASDRPTLATTGNLNNHIGVPLTLLGITKDHRMVVVEMGANKPGDIAELAAIAEPTHGLITNIGKAHLEGFGNFEGVVRTKTELYTFVRDHQGSLFVNADDELLMSTSAGSKRLTYGQAPTADTHGTAQGKGHFLELAYGDKDGKDRLVKTKLIGNYNLPNALAAVAIGKYFGVSDDHIATALSSYEPGNNRSQFTDTGKNQLILDAYNANPTSMSVALENFADMKSEHPKLVILGDMLELGAESEKEHAHIVGLVQKLGLRSFFVGPRFVAALGAAGTSARSDVGSMLAELIKEPVQLHLILLKGSRGVRLEKLVPAL